MIATTNLRSADLDQLREVLDTQRAQRVDRVVAAAHLHAEGGRVYLEGDRLTITGGANDGAWVDEPRYDLTDVAEDGVSEKFGIHRAYLRKLREQHVELWDENVNAWARHESMMGTKLMVRLLRDDTTGEGVVRAVLSNGFRTIENLDVVVAVLQGIRAAGIETTIKRCDLTERKMYVALNAPEVQVQAPRLLDGYRGPWHAEALAARRIITPAQAEAFRTEGDPDGTAHGYGGNRGMYDPGTEPIIMGGLTFSNSDVGAGAFALAAQPMILRCTNGMTLPAGAVRKVHIGDRHDVGEIDWAADTQEAKLEEIRLMTRDSVRAFLSPEWLGRQIAELEERAGVAIPRPVETIKTVTKALNYSQAVADDVFAHFIAGGQLTAGGVMHAVTSVAQTVPSGDDAATMEGHAVRALDLAVQYA
jgi:hypothetical protein